MAFRTATLVVLLTILWICIAFQEAETTGTSERLIRQVFRFYNPAIIPSLGKMEPVNVTLGLSMLHYLNLDADLGVITLFMLERYGWTDPRLAWDPSDFGDIDAVVVPYEHVWRPDIALYNEYPLEITSVARPDVVLQSNGSVSWLLRVTKAVDCYSDQETFTWICYLVYGSWNYPGFLLNLIPSAEGINERAMGMLRNGLMPVNASLVQHHAYDPKNNTNMPTSVMATLHVISLKMNFGDQFGDGLGDFGDGGSTRGPSSDTGDAKTGRDSDRPSLLDYIENMPDYDLPPLTRPRPTVYRHGPPTMAAASRPSSTEPRTGAIRMDGENDDVGNSGCGLHVGLMTQVIMVVVMGLAILTSL